MNHESTILAFHSHRSGLILEQEIRGLTHQLRSATSRIKFLEGILEDVISLDLIQRTKRRKETKNNGDE